MSGSGAFRKMPLLSSASVSAEAGAATSAVTVCFVSRKIRENEDPSLMLEKLKPAPGSEKQACTSCTITDSSIYFR